MDNQQIIYLLLLWEAIEEMIIINADDYGYDKTVTNAIIDAFSKQLITDTTMMANGEAYEYAIEMIREKSISDRIGFHMNLTEGEPLTEQIKKLKSFTTDGRFHGNISRSCILNKDEKEAVYKEISAQMKKLIDSGIQISHADSHHHIHTVFSIAPIFLKVCKENGINKIRIHRNIGDIPFYKRCIKNSYNLWLRKNGITTVKNFGNINDMKYTGLLDNMEIMVHPDYDSHGVLIDRIKREGNIAIGPKLLPISDDIDALSTYKKLK